MRVSATLSRTRLAITADDGQPSIEIGHPNVKNRGRGIEKQPLPLH